ncbi:hypothetical protein [Frateuria defendens]|uniref:hypothetical protein n=1 Tax=Frateuria defendens TaxID=2219559 RepID=UPI001292DB02|nr:hypothetical protein [Frateuria defendens]
MSDTNGPDSNLFQDQKSAKEAKVQLESWITRQSTVADAIQKLESHGFSCGPAKQSSPDVRSSVLCMYTSAPPPPPSQRITTPPGQVRWFVTLNSKDGIMVSDLHVARLPPDIGG